MVQITLPTYLTEEQLYYYKKSKFKWEQFCFIKKKKKAQNFVQILRPSSGVKRDLLLPRKAFEEISFLHNHQNFISHI